MSQLLTDQRSVQRAPPVDAPSATRPINLFPPSALGNVAGGNSSYSGIQAWLDANRATVAITPMSGLQRAVRQQVPAANNLPTNEVRAVITGWADARHVPLQDDGPRQRERVPDSALESLAMGAMSLASGVKIGHEEGLTEISVFGAQVGVGDEDLGVGASVAWEGKFGLFATYGGVRLTGEVSQESWRIELSFPGDAAMPEFGDSLRKVFVDANEAIGQGAAVASTAQGPDDAQNKIRPFLGPLREAVESLSAIAGGAPVSFGVGLEIPRGDGASEAAAGGPAGPSFQITARLTIRF
ncbi:MAG: hypothetical protein E6I07_07390 [Chloroflexi bacterium]|nr:MAG: hypothetical protein E6I07_07390 [Chloroflexota bacterium]